MSEASEASSSRAHRWSGWPGAFCLDCGAEHAVENALGLGWLGLDPERPDWEEWKSPLHKELVELCDQNCPKKMTAEEYAPIRARIEELDKIAFTEEKK